MARTCEILEDEGGIAAKVLRDALQVPIPQDYKEFEARTFKELTARHDSGAFWGLSADFARLSAPVSGGPNRETLVGAFGGC